VSAPPRIENLADAYATTLGELGAADPKIAVFDAGGSQARGGNPFREKFPDRFFAVDDADESWMARASEMALAGRTVFASTLADRAAGTLYPSVRHGVCYSGASVKIAATHASFRDGGERGGHPMFEDIGLMRALPGMTVVVPADAPSTRTATRAVAARPGPAYLRLAAGPLPTVTEGSFAIGKATELRGGSDLTIVALGTFVARALTLAAELGQVGVSARVLDFASVKPFDEPALLRAARDTGAILVLEEHSVLTGVGARGAATTSENNPVPVRRVGMPDLLGEVGEPEALRDRYGMSAERIRDEAWELLRLRGKVQ
jgi:transketolase